MGNNENLSIALNILERKIANLNMKILEKNTSELQKELDKYLKLKTELYKGNTSIIQQIVNKEDK